MAYYTETGTTINTPESRQQISKIVAITRTVVLNTVAPVIRRSVQIKVH